MTYLEACDQLNELLEIKGISVSDATYRIEGIEIEDAKRCVRSGLSIIDRINIYARMSR